MTTAPDTAPRGEPRGEHTRQVIVDTALRLFREQGYDKTTMRAIAAEAGLSVGNAYYYFPTKEHLVQEFYTRIQHDHRAAVAPLLANGSGEFGKRLHAAMRTGIDVMAPYHGFAGKFIKTAADPDSALSPFSPDSTPAREISLDIFREVVSGTTTKIEPDLRAELPELLWLAQLGVTLFWVHDRSHNQAKTRTLIDGAVPLVDRLVGLAKYRVLRPAVRDALTLYRTLRD